MTTQHTPEFAPVESDRTVLVAPAPDGALIAYGLDFGEWLRLAQRTDSASEYDLRAAWRAGENPEDYIRREQS